MGKIIYEGLITDPNDPVYKRGWTITLYPMGRIEK